MFTPLFSRILIILSLLAATQIAVVADSPAWQSKVDTSIITAAAAGETEFLVFMQAQADLRPAASLPDKTTKGAFVYERLTTTAASSQQPLRAYLDELGADYQSFWVANMIWVRGDYSTLRGLALHEGVAHIYSNPQVQNILPEPAQPDQHIPTQGGAFDAVEWNIAKIQADQVWAAGINGQGVVIGGQDTGYDWDHPALISQYRGWDGSSASHDYSWFDGTGLSPQTPVDPHGHGTHTMGTMVGGTGGRATQIGVAPEARWIGCRNMDGSGVGSPATYAACYQWFIAPTRTDGSAPRPDLAPDVINNSWSCPASEGCTTPEILLTAVQAVRAAGILTVHSAGNTGTSGCSSIYDPPAIYAESFTVGSTNAFDQIAYSSARGPVTVDGSQRLKPQVTAPGVSVYSTYHNGGYTTLSGTSMAAPHVAGLAALLISAQPSLSGQVDQLETIITQTAQPIFTTEGCGGDTPTSRPNNTYGWGRVNAWDAYTSLNPGIELQLTKTAPEEIIAGSTLTYTLTVTNLHTISSTHQIVLTDTIPSGTTFITATAPYTKTQDLLTWPFGNLTPNASKTVNLIIQVPLTHPAASIVNQEYGTVSLEVPLVVGSPIYTTIIPPFLTHLPIIQLPTR